MAYVKQVWQDRVTEYPFRRKLYPQGHDPEDGAEYADIVRAQGEVFAEGTPVTAERLNHMENGIFAKQDAITAENKLPYAYIANVPAVLPNPCPLTFGQKTYDGTASQSLSPADIGLGTVFNLRGSKADTSGLPSSGNTVGDVWYVISEHVGYVWLNDGTARWEQLGLPVDLSGYAEIGGTYPGMSVGHAAEADSAETAEYADVSEYSAYADQLDSTVALTVSSPFVFRPSGGGADVEGYLGSRAKTAAVYGNTLVWNQLVDDDTTGVMLESGHVYLTRIDGADTLVSGSGASVSVTGGTDNVFDLTRMFGTGNVPASAEDFRAFFPLPYYAYDTGSLLHFTGTGIKTVGFNQWDEEWESGTYDDFGNKTTQVHCIRSKNKIHVLPNTIYFFKIGTEFTRGIVVLELRSNTVLRKITNVGVGGLKTVQTSANADALVFYSYAINDVTEYNHDICLNLSWSGYRNGEYEPHHAETKALPVSTYFPDGMMSAGTVRDELRADMAVRRCGVRAYQEGDESDQTVVTDGTNTVYALAEPVEAPIDPPLDLTFNSSDYGTEMLLPENSSAPVTSPMCADIRYVQNLRDKLQRLPCSPESAGWYFVRYDGVRQSYERLPALPAESGSYVLKCTVGEQEHTFFWETEADTE